MARAVAQGGGTMAQFNVPELGGSGQWMAGGMTMVGDMFNTGLQAAVSNLCVELAEGMSVEQFFKAPASPSASAWWPEEFGAPSSVGGQNQMRYAHFPNARRIAVDRGDGGPIIVLDTLDHAIGGFSQQQSGAGDPFHGVSFSSQRGQFSLATLPPVGAAAAEPHSEPTPEEPSAQPQPAEATASLQDAVAPSQNQQPPKAQEPDVFETLERLAKLRDGGVVTEEEFAEKKAELLKRL